MNLLMREILEIHHRHKKDSPSGTAKSLVQSIHRGRKDEDKNAYVFHNELVRKQVRYRSCCHTWWRDLRFSYRFIFLSNGESLSLKHESSDRSIYAKDH